MTTDAMFRHLFTPFTIGKVTLVNRICLAAHATNYGDLHEDPPGERQAYYLAERAKGGAGLIIASVAGAVPWRGSAPFVRSPEYAQWQLRRNRLITEMVHRQGVPIFAQMSHGTGRQLLGRPARPDAAPISASPIADPFTRFVPHELTESEIAEIVDATTATAASIREAGYDGLEFHATHAGYLIQQFLSPLSNKRTDRYGGSLENRMTLLLECIEATRQGVDSDFVVGLRLSIDEFHEGGLALEESLEIVRSVEATGQIDYLSIDGGNYANMSLIFPDMSLSPGFFVGLAAAVRNAVDLPVIASHRINDPVLAEKILADGQADLVAMARALLCDPELPRKAREGRLDAIRHCVACNEGCTWNLFQGLPITCIQNPVAGREKEWATLPPVARRKRVLVLGGGPAGMKAAETAAERGHEIVLCERNAELGGQVTLQARVASRQEYGELVRHLGHRLRELGVEVRLGTEMTVESVLAEAADAVIVATGSAPIKAQYTNMRPDLPNLPGAERDDVLTEEDVLGGAQFGDNVVVVDDTEGDYKTPLVAEYLADRGAQVTVLTTAHYLGLSVPEPNFRPMYQRLFDKGIDVMAHTGVRAIGDHSLVTYNVYTDEEGAIEGVDTVVLVLGHRPNDDLYRALEGRVPALYQIGDSVAPRRVMDAIREGAEIGRSL